MARPKTIDDETILSAAREVFQESGLGATTAQVAKRAGVSEGSVFRRFPSKQELFLAAMGIAEPSWISGIQTQPSESFWSDLELLAHQIIDHMIKVIPKVILMHSSIMKSDIPDDAVPVVMQKKIVEFVSANADKSPIFENAEDAARIFFGALHFYVFSNVVGVGQKFDVDQDRYVATLLTMMGAGNPQ